MEVFCAEVFDWVFCSSIDGLLLFFFTMLVGNDFDNDLEAFETENEQVEVL